MRPKTLLRPLDLSANWTLRYSINNTITILDQFGNPLPGVRVDEGINRIRTQGIAHLHEQTGWFITNARGQVGDWHSGQPTGLINHFYDNFWQTFKVGTWETDRMATMVYGFVDTRTVYIIGAQQAVFK